MNRLLCWLVPLLLALASSAQAQLSLGVEGGWNKNYLSTSNNSQYFTEYVNQAGFSVGIPVEYRFLDWLAIEADPGLIRKNYKQQRTDFFSGIYQKSTNTYLQLPVMVKFSFGGEQLRGYMSLGGYLAYWASGRIKGTTVGTLNTVDTAYNTVNPTSLSGENYPYNFDMKYTFNNTRDNRLELGAVAAIGVSYEYLEKYNFFIEARYTRSLTDMQKNYELNQTPRYNDTYGLSAGCMIRLNYFSSGASARQKVKDPR